MIFNSYLKGPSSYITHRSDVSVVYPMQLGAPGVVEHIRRTITFIDNQQFVKLFTVVDHIWRLVRPCGRSVSYHGPTKRRTPHFMNIKSVVDHTFPLEGLLCPRLFKP